MKRRKGERTTDYRRSVLDKKGGPATADTRMSFIHASAALARQMRPDLPENWEVEAKARWSAADEVFKTATRLETESDQ